MGKTEMQSLVARAAGAAIRCIAANPKGTRLAVATEYVSSYILAVLRPNDSNPLVKQQSRLLI